MSTKEDYEAKLGVITAIEDDKIKTPNSIPVDVYIQEAEGLYHWSQADKEQMNAKGLPLELVDDIPIRSGALREAESLWSAQRFTREEAAEEWAEKSPLAYAFRNDLLNDLRFAFRNDPQLSGRVKAIAEGGSHADMIQDLNDLSVLGRQNPELLAAVNFDTLILDQSAQMADELAALLAAATGERLDTSESKRIRDQAYTHLKNAVDEIRAYGQYVFRHNDTRLKGYRSNYLRRRSTGGSSAPAAPDTPDTPDTGEGSA